MRFIHFDIFDVKQLAERARRLHHQAYTYPVRGYAHDPLPRVKKPLAFQIHCDNGIYIMPNIVGEHSSFDSRNIVFAKGHPPHSASLSNGITPIGPINDPIHQSSFPVRWVDTAIKAHCSHFLICIQSTNNHEPATIFLLNSTTQTRAITLNP